MKLTNFGRIAVLGLVLALAATGCKKRPTPLTLLPPGGARTGGIENPPPAQPFNVAGNNPGGDVTGQNTPGGPGADANKTGGIPFGPGHENWIPNTEIFKQDTVYFDFDSSVVKGGERSKVNHVADYLKSHANTAVRVEGHCDERGTEEYNRALGDRRSIAIREDLVKAGVDATRVDTISYGKDRPEDPGHNEAAWSKNRRGVFVLLTPPTTP